MIETNFIYDAKTKQSTIEERELTPAEIQAKEEEASKLANERRIAELKANLTATDYQAIKFAEGQITAEDYAETKAQRQAWRNEINQLES